MKIINERGREVEGNFLIKLNGEVLEIRAGIEKRKDLSVMNPIALDKHEVDIALGDMLLYKDGNYKVGGKLVLAVQDEYGGLNIFDSKLTEKRDGI